MKTLLTHSNPDMKHLSFTKAVDDAWDALDISLRNGFDTSCILYTAQGYIEAAKSLGRYELANEMESDLKEMITQSTALELSRKEVA